MARGFSYFLFPIVSTVVWEGTLIAMLVWWTAKGEPHFASMSPSQHIAYISDVGAQLLKPLFIAGSAVTVVSFDMVFITEKWLRHKGVLAPQTSKSEKIFSLLSCIFSVIGAAGLILLSIFDTLRYPHVHDAMLCVFIAGYILTALCVCAEYQRLGIHQRQFRLLRFSFWLKLVWVIIFLGLAIAFGVENKKKHYNRAAKLEWAIAFLFGIFVLSFAIDFLPAIKTRHHHNRFSHRKDSENSDAETNQLGGPAFSREPGFSTHQPMVQTGRSVQPGVGANF